MAKCTAPSQGHRTTSGAESCPVHGGLGRYGGGYSSYSSGYNNYGSISSPANSTTRSGSGSSQSSRPKWSRASSSVVYTPVEIQTLTPYRETIEKQSAQPDNRDVFLCHAWNDREGAAKELYDLLLSRKVTVWFSEVDLRLGTPMLREIDKGLAKSRVGIVLVTPAFLERIKGDGSIADKELSALLARDQLIPIAHLTTFESLRNVSPLLGSRSGLTTGKDQTMAQVAEKIAELVTV